jgi:hypothetical protein
MTTSYGFVKSGADLSFQTLYVPLSSDGEDVAGALIFASIKPREV